MQLIFLVINEISNELIRKMPKKVRVKVVKIIINDRKWNNQSIKSKTNLIKIAEYLDVKLQKFEAPINIELNTESGIMESKQLQR